jgi:hypothetical protein
MIRLLLIALLLTSVADAQWSTDPSNNLIVGYGLNSEICSDGAGGAYVTYEYPTTFPRRIELRRLNRYGYQPWGSSRAITGERAQNASARMVADGQGGVIISYIDSDVIWPQGWLISRVRVQRVDSAGNFMWGSTGVRVSTAEHSQYTGAAQSIVSDGTGGCIVAWVDTLDDLRMNRVNGTGVRVWGDSGQYVANSTATPPLASDGREGCYIGFGVGRLQRFNSQGIPYWPLSVQIPTSGALLQVDSETNVYLLGKKVLGYRNGELLFTVNLQKVDTLGNLVWDSLGVVLDTINANNFPLVWGLSLNSKYRLVCWPQKTGGVWDLRTQTVRSDGSTVFPFGGVAVGRSLSGKSLIGLSPSDSVTTLFAWWDSRNPVGVYGQRLDSLARVLWDTNDIALSTMSMGGLRVIPDGNGGCILAGWRETDFTVRTQQISRLGVLGQVIAGFENMQLEKQLEQFWLFQNYPNPFNPLTTIRFNIPIQSHVSLALYDLLGREVQSLVDETLPAGNHHAVLSSSGLSSGVYLYRIQWNSGNITRKLLVLK